ncbi:MAG: hypothetical protein ACKPCM_01670 [Pseudanabaena sp.]
MGDQIPHKRSPLNKPTTSKSDRLKYPYTGDRPLNAQQHQTAII